MREKPGKITFMMALKHTDRAWAGHMRKVALETGIPDSYRDIIMFLSRHPDSTQKELSKFSHTTYAAISQTVKEMQLMGYIVKEPDKNDKRFSRLRLTQKGEESVSRVLDKLHDADDEITKALGGEQKEREMIELLEKISEIIRNKQ